MFLSLNKKNIRIFLSENFHFLVVKVSLYLNRHVFVSNMRLFAVILKDKLPSYNQ